MDILAVGLGGYPRGSWISSEGAYGYLRGYLRGLWISNLTVGSDRGYPWREILITWDFAMTTKVLVSFPDEVIAAVDERSASRGRSALIVELVQRGLAGGEGAGQGGVAPGPEPKGGLGGGARAECERRVLELEEEVKRLKRELAKRPAADTPVQAAARKAVEVSAPSSPGSEYNSELVRRPVDRVAPIRGSRKVVQPVVRREGKVDVSKLDLPVGNIRGPRPKVEKKP